MTLIAWIGIQNKNGDLLVIADAVAARDIYLLRTIRIKSATFLARKFGHDVGAMKLDRSRANAQRVARSLARGALNDQCEDREFSRREIFGTKMRQHRQPLGQNCMRVDAKCAPPLRLGAAVELSMHSGAVCLPVEAPGLGNRASRWPSY